jgi:phosphohistidine phosphatase SixA
LGEIYVSPACRAQDTARLLDAGKAIVTPDLAQVGAPGFDVHIARMARLATPPAAGRNTLLVSHMHGSNVWEQQLMIEMAEVAVYRPLGEGKSEPVARIPLGAWAELARTAGS